MRTSIRHAVLAGVSLLGLAGPAMAQAQSDSRVATLEQELSDIRAQVAELKKAQGAARSKVGLDNGRLTVASADGRFTLSLRALLQYDAGYFAQGKNGAVPDLSSGTNFRRAQIGVAGTAFRDWSYNFTLDFAGNGVEKSGYIYSAYLEYDGLKPFALRIGAYTPPQGLEDQTGSGDLLFNERASAVDAARNIAGAPSRSAISLLLAGDTYFAGLSYTGNKVGDSGAFDEQQALVGRLAWLPVNTADAKWLLDGDFSHVFKPADKAPGAPPLTTMLAPVSFSAGPELAVDDNSPKTVNTGSIDADSVTTFGAESAAQFRTLHLQGGWFHYAIARRDPALPDPSFHGWYALATWSLTGETHAYDPATATFRGLKPLHGLGSDGFGAWELKARYSSLDLDDNPLTAAAAGGVAGGVQNIWTLGTNWYPTNGIRFAFEYSNLHVHHVNLPASDISADEFGLRTQLSL